jgi:NTP pyrophosphatase (non-canonical NTP hydrolase)
MDTMIEKIVKFVNERNWQKFHNPKDLAISLNLEAAEDDISDELVDVLYWVLLMSHYLDVDLKKSFERKMKQNEKKYPVDKAMGKHSKYTAYQNE